MVTVGMNYEVVEGKGEVFVDHFARVVEALQSVNGHAHTELFNSVSHKNTFLVVSEWQSREAFDAFVASDVFRKTTRWGQNGILASRPKHEVYGDKQPLSHEAKDDTASTTERCPVH